MNYSTPELVVLGPATELVLGGDTGRDDNILPQVEEPAEGLALGLDD